MTVALPRPAPCAGGGGAGRRGALPAGVRGLALAGRLVLPPPHQGLQGGGGGRGTARATTVRCAHMATHLKEGGTGYCALVQQSACACLLLPRAAGHGFLAICAKLPPPVVTIPAVHSDSLLVLLVSLPPSLSAPRSTGRPVPTRSCCASPPACTATCSTRGACRAAGCCRGRGWTRRSSRAARSACRGYMRGARGCHVCAFGLPVLCFIIVDCVLPIVWGNACSWYKPKVHSQHTRAVPSAVLAHSAQLHSILRYRRERTNRGPHCRRFVVPRSFG